MCRHCFEEAVLRQVFLMLSSIIELARKLLERQLLIEIWFQPVALAILNLVLLIFRQWVR